jgi:hypothetical protein
MRQLTADMSQRITTTITIAGCIGVPFRTVLVLRTFRFLTSTKNCRVSEEWPTANSRVDMKLPSPISTVALSHSDARSNVGVATRIQGISIASRAICSSMVRNHSSTVAPAIMITLTEVQQHRLSYVAMLKDFRDCPATKFLCEIQWHPGSKHPRCRATASH